MHDSLTCVPSRFPSAVCAPEVNPRNNCTAVDGTIRVFLADPGQIEEAKVLIVKMVRRVVKGNDFVDQVGAGLIKISLLADDDIPPESRNPEGQIPGSIDGEEESFGAFSFVIVAVGSAALVAFVGSVFYWKRGGGEGDGMATEAAGTSIFNDSDISSGVKQSSPFSEMLPSAYRYNDNMSILTGQGGMSPVFEDDGSASQSTGAYTDLEQAETMSFDMPKSVYSENDTDISADAGTTVASSPLLLGARKRVGGSMTAGLHMSDMESDTGSSVQGDDSLAGSDDASATSSTNMASSTAFDTLLGRPEPRSPQGEDKALLFDDFEDEEDQIFDDIETDDEQPVVVTLESQGSLALENVATDEAMMDTLLHRSP